MVVERGDTQAQIVGGLKEKFARRGVQPCQGEVADAHYPPEHHSAAGGGLSRQSH
jgi:hypothetical protein